MDNKGEKCDKKWCRGTYEEYNIWEDLKCTKCGLCVERWSEDKVRGYGFQIIRTESVPYDAVEVFWCDTLRNVDASFIVEFYPLKKRHMPSDLTICAIDAPDENDINFDDYDRGSFKAYEASIIDVAKKHYINSIKR